MVNFLHKIIKLSDNAMAEKSSNVLAINYLLNRHHSFFIFYYLWRVFRGVLLVFYGTRTISESDYLTLDSISIVTSKQFFQFIRNMTAFKIFMAIKFLFDYWFLFNDFDFNFYRIEFSFVEFESNGTICYAMHLN